MKNDSQRLTRKDFIQKTSKSLSQGIAAPLVSPVFRLLWIGNFLSNLGTMMHAVAAAWLMTSLTTSPLLIGLVQTAFNLPVLLIGIPCGVFADLFDRRRLLIIAQCWMIVFALLTALMAGLGKISPYSLLAFIFSLGIGAALHFPTWLALLQNLVMEEHVPAAVSLNSMAFNLARTLGPALGGFLVHLLGAPLIFLANGLSFIAVLLGLLRVPVNCLPEMVEKQRTLHHFFRSLLEMGTFVIASRRLVG
ncbi:MAG: MFS transporter, partial [Chthoniobacterales bacterium]